MMLKKISFLHWIKSQLKRIHINNTQATVVRSTLIDDNSEDDFIPSDQHRKSEFYTQKSLNDIIRDFGLPKDAAKHLASVEKSPNGKNNFLVICSNFCLFK